jgi:hypothetical protein
MKRTALGVCLLFFLELIGGRVRPTPKDTAHARPAGQGGVPSGIVTGAEKSGHPEHSEGSRSQAGYAPLQRFFAALRMTVFGNVTVYGNMTVYGNFPIPCGVQGMAFWTTMP